MRRFATTTLAICIATAASADETRTMEHLSCAAFAELSLFPLARMEGADKANAEADRLRDAHLSEALRLGVPLIDEGGSGFAGRLLKPAPIGGSAEAGIGAFFARLAWMEDHLFEMRHGAPQTDERSLDARFEDLADWYRARAAYMIEHYKIARCNELL